MWKTYEVKMKFIGKLCGSVPIDPELIKNWLEARKPRVKPPGSKSIDETAKEVTDSVANVNEQKEMEDRVTLAFQTYDGGLVMRGGTVKAHLKDCARVLSSLYMGKIQGERSLAIRVLNCINVQEYWIPLLRDGAPIKEADNYFDKAVHVQTMRGPRNALKRILYLEKPEMKFHLKILENQSSKLVVSIDDLKKVFEFGCLKGYGGERGDGEGRYEFTIEEIQVDNKVGNS